VTYEALFGRVSGRAWLLLGEGALMSGGFDSWQQRFAKGV